MILNRLFYIAEKLGPVWFRINRTIEFELTEPEKDILVAECREGPQTNKSEEITQRLIDSGVISINGYYFKIKTK